MPSEEAMWATRAATTSGDPSNMRATPSGLWKARDGKERAEVSSEEEAQGGLNEREGGADL